MKKILTVIALTAAVMVHAQDDKFTGAMKKNLAQFDSVKTTQDYTNLANNFERIGDAEKTQWLPYYYAGLALTTAAWSDQSLDKDKNAEKVKALCDKAEAIEKNAEILTIRNMAATQQMMVDPQNRWQTYGMEAGSALQKGMQIDPNNPRLYYLQGMSIFNTPEQFGGGKDKAKPIFEKAVALFKAAQPKPLYPNWGQKQAEDMLAKCQ
ncbi:hypothetical protein [Foetidibacter luteolus]|uniref:hypothetical protein n=1 Tax=Foetidibacter luteolus TaxID=2608880 RepID=UPI00129ABD78|nr:hypothetical protein [Foetidibacter luteolus]